jgi:hypothetical protein
MLLKAFGMPPRELLEVEERPANKCQAHRDSQRALQKQWHDHCAGISFAGLLQQCHVPAGLRASTKAGLGRRTAQAARQSGLAAQLAVNN